jgi:hypothetical protein
MVMVTPARSTRRRRGNGRVRSGFAGAGPGGGCIVIAARGTSAFFGDASSRAAFEPAPAGGSSNLYFDTSVLGSMFRWRTLPRILATPGLVSRAIHGSYPFPSNAMVSQPPAPASWPPWSGGNLIDVTTS